MRFVGTVVQPSVETFANQCSAHNRWYTTTNNMGATVAIVSSLDFSEVVDGIRKYVRLTGLAAMSPLAAKNVRDEFDLAHIVSAIPYFVKNTKRMVGKSKHPHTPFDHIDDVTKDMEEYMLVGRDSVSTAVKRKHNLVSFHLVVVPTLRVLSQIGSHVDCIKWVDRVIEHVVETLIYGSGVETTLDDAIVARHQINRMVEQREAERKLKAHSKPRKKKGGMDLEKLMMV